MRLRKSLGLLIISMLVFVSSFFSINIKASEIDTVKESQYQELLSQKTVVISSNQDNANAQISTLQKNALDKLTNARSSKPEDAYIENTFSRLSSSSKSIKTGIGIDTVTLEYSIVADKKSKTITASVEITKVSGIPPAALVVTQFLQTSDIQNPIMGDWYHDDIFDNPIATWNTLQIYKGQKISETVSAKTKWWGAFGSATAYFVNETEDTTSWETPYTLVNKSGVPFPDYTNPWTGQKASEKVKTNWTKTSTPVKWTSTIRQKAQKEYDKAYPSLNINWTNYELHHIRPRAYGGSNELKNLLPIPKTAHSAISGWFNGY